MLRCNITHPIAQPLSRPGPRSTRLPKAARYASPATGSVVLVSDPAALAALTPPLSRLRCAACGEQHLLVLDETGGNAAP